GTLKRIEKVQSILHRSNCSTGAIPFDSTPLNFQIWLYEGSNQIEIHYNGMSITSGMETFGQIGLRGLSNADFLMFDWKAPNGDWPTLPGTMPVTTTDATAAVSIRGAANLAGPSRGLTASNRLFRFRPVNCVRPTWLNVTSSASNSLQVGWTAANPAPADGYEYYYTTSATAPTSATPASGSVGAGVTTALIGGLPSSTVHYIY